jgi:hypothetical protein
MNNVVSTGISVLGAANDSLRYAAEVAIGEAPGGKAANFLIKFSGALIRWKLKCS